jgi:hypothetical protein
MSGNFLAPTFEDNTDTLSEMSGRADSGWSDMAIEFSDRPRKASVV